VDLDSYIIFMCFGQEIKKSKNDLYQLLCLKFFMSLQCSDLCSKKHKLRVFFGHFSRQLEDE
jgi:hypothetical protein